MLASQLLSLLASQMCKYVNMYVTCEVPPVHPVHLLPQHPVLQASLYHVGKFVTQHELLCMRQLHVRDPHAYRTP